MATEGKRYQVWGQRKMFGEFAFNSCATQKFDELCKENWKRSYYIYDIVQDRVVAERNIHAISFGS